MEENVLPVIALVCFDRLGAIPTAVALQVEEDFCPHMDDRGNVGQWEDIGWCTCLYLGKNYNMRTPCPYLEKVTKDGSYVFIHCK
jgi:hypothetical protein